jgi:Ser/Thr protein kinase RdoA (MazF antagonist)
MESEAFEAFGARYHAAFDTPEATVFEMVLRATGKRARSRRRVFGATNEVYTVIAEDAAKYLVKIRRDAASSLASEAWAAGRYREAGVPTPEVLLVDRGEQGGEEFMVQALAEGRCMEEMLDGLRPDERISLWLRAGLILARMHSVEVDGFGCRNPDGTWEFPTWQADMDAALRAGAAERPWVLETGLTDQELDEILRLATRYREEFDCLRPVLCHSDFIPEHLFVDAELRISGVVDFGDCCGNHPVHDFAVMGDEEEGGARAAEGYAEERPLPERLQERRQLHRLLLELRCMARLVRLGHPLVPQHVQWLRELLKWLREKGW